MPRVSVCTSVLNQSDFLKRMIDSVRAQTFEDWELVLVDDGSTEDISGIVRSYDDPRIKLHIFPENKGIPHGLNYAFEHAIGDYLQPLSADEWITPDKLRVQVEYLDSHPSIGCVWGLPWKGEMGERPEWEQYAWKAHNRPREAWIRDLMQCKAPIGGTSLLMRRSCYLEIGGFDPQFFQCSDLEWYVRFFQKFDGALLPYRWGDSDQPADRASAPTPDKVARFQDDIKRLMAKHEIKPPKGDGRLTIGIPIRNMSETIGETLNSLRAQTFQDFDVMIMDDASEDEMLLTSKLLEFQDMRIKYYRFDEHRGIAEADNQMLARCETEFFSVLSADDTLEPTALSAILAQFKRDPWLEFVASQTDFIDKEGKPYLADHPMKRIVKASNKDREVWLHQLYYGNQYFGFGIYRTAAVKQIGGWSSEYGPIMDYAMYVALLQRENIYVVEENLTHTRIHDKQASRIEGHDAVVKLKSDYAKIHKRFWPPRMKVIIATPFYELRGFSPYISSMFNTAIILAKMNIDCEFWELSGDSYVERAKNTICTRFLEDEDATDLFMIDSDMQWNPDAVPRILMLPEEIIVGSYPQKNQWGRWTSLPKTIEDEGKHHPIGRVLDDGTALIQAEYLAGGFVRMKRSVLEKYRDHFPELRYQDTSADPGAPNREYVQVFNCETRTTSDGKQKLRWGEDRIFGERLKEMGIDVFIYPNITFGHYGVKGWTGNFDTWLRAPKALQDAEADPMVQNMNSVGTAVLQ